jgi:hypothetical protein
MGILSLILGLVGLGTSVAKSDTEAKNEKQQKDYKDRIYSMNTADQLNQQAQQRKETLARAIGAGYPYGPYQSDVRPRQPENRIPYAANTIGGVAQSAGAVNWDKVFNQGQGAPVASGIVSQDASGGSFA